MSDRRAWQREADRLGRADPAHPTAWFERLWSAARRGEVTTPWDRTEPHPALASWASPADGPGRTAAVVGCGLGADAEHFARLGYTTTAFDISPSAVAAARARNPGSPVTYAVADLLDLPPAWAGAFHLVVEIYTVQAVSRGVREAMVDGVRSLVAPGGTLFVVQAAAEEPDDEGPPWPLTRAELELFAADGLTTVSVEEIEADGRPSWRAAFRRP